MEQQTYDLFRRYALGQLPENERHAFEQRLHSDAAFAEEVTAWAAVHNEIQAEGDRRLEEVLRDLGKKLMQENSPELNAAPPGRVFHLPRWVYAAAAAVLLVLIARPVYQLLQPAAPALASNQSLVEQHFRVPQVPEVRDAQVTAWREAYQNKNYEKAITDLEKLLADPSYAGRSEAQLYLGISHLAAGQGRQALDALQQVAPDSYDWDDAQWYSALAYLIVDDVVHAKLTLQYIAVQNGNTRQKEAQEMLKELK